MVNSYWNEIIIYRDEIYTLYRRALTKADEGGDILEEAEMSYFELLRVASLAREEGLESSEIEELDKLLEEVDNSRKTIRTDIRTKF